MRYFDTHAHYYDERFVTEYEGSAEELIGALLKDKVSHIINVGTSPETCRLAIEQAKKFTNMYTALGIHPSDTRFIATSADEAIAEIERMVLDRENKCVAIGEIGLDYHYPDTNKEIQDYYFNAQMRLAKKLSMPVVIHDRDAHEDTLNVIKRHTGVVGVLHSYSGSVEMAKELVKCGYMISFSGTISFKNAKRPAEVAAAIPKECVLIETDSPYLAPHPLRGTLNHSGNLVYTNAALSAAWGISEEECARITSENARRFFNIV